MNAIRDSLLEFLITHPGIWTNEKLAEMFRCHRSIIAKHLKTLRQSGLVAVRTERNRIGSRWWVRRYLEVVKNHKELN